METVLIVLVVLFVLGGGVGDTLGGGANPVPIKRLRIGVLSISRHSRDRSDADLPLSIATSCKCNSWG